MFKVNDLKIKNKISLVFILVVVMELIQFIAAYKGMENVTFIKESQNNMMIFSLSAIAITIALGFLLINLICKPIEKLNNTAKRIQNGNFNEEIDIVGDDEIGELADSLKMITRNINNLVDDSNLILKSVEKGDFNINLNKSKYNGTWKNISENNLAAAGIFIKSINTIADYIGKISRGETIAKYNQEEAGEFNSIKDNINKLCDNLNYFIKDINWLKDTFKEGNTRDKLDVSQYKGFYKEMAECVNETTWISIDVFIKLFAVLQGYAQGDFSVELEKFPGRYGLVNENVENLRTNLLSIAKEQINIAKEIENGDLSKRVDASKFSGSWAEMIDGINGIIDAFIDPITITADYVKRIGNGEVPDKIEKVYHGEFNQIKNNLNLLIDTLNMFVKEVNWINETFKLGNTEDKIDISKFDGVYRQMAQSVNDGMRISVDVLNKIFAVQKSYSEGDFSVELEKLPGKYNIANESLNNLRTNILKIVAEEMRVLEAAADGNLQIRGESEEFSGSFKELINIINKAVEAFSKPIREIDYALSEMANGNLDIYVENSYNGDYASIINSLNSSIETINGVFTDINIASKDVAAGSSQVADGSQALSQGATEQASAIEELTSSITEVAAQTKENALNANEAKELAIKVKENAEEGNRHMSEMLKSMGEINESSANISKIIKVIDEIAFQTNILALNAAVEAARAGQHGKGFAVVAEEVRNLAARSANAAKETTDLIEGSIRKAEKGTEIANHTAKALYEIVDGVSKATALVAEIAASSNEQATGISQINLGIEQVSQVVQTNSATAEESASASEELSSQSELLKEKVASFKLKNNGGNSSLNNTNKNKEAYIRRNNESFKEVAATIHKPRIALSDNEFGKY